MLRVLTTFTGVTGSPWTNATFWTGADNQTGADNAVAAVGAFWGAVDALMGTAVLWSTDPEVAQLTTAGERTGGFVTTPQSGAGALSTDLLPIQTQALVRLLTGSFINGRQVRGKINVPGLTETANTLGLLASASRTTIQTAADTLIATASPAFSIWSRKNATAVAVDTASVSQTWAVRRSRRD